MKSTRHKALGVPKAHSETCMTRKPEQDRTHSFCDCNAHTNVKRFERIAKKQQSTTRRIGR